MKRLFDFVIATMLVIFLAVPMLLVAIVVLLTSKGPALYWSDRVGQYNVIFKMPKFRTMILNTPEMATHLMSKPDTFLSPLGGGLRRSSLDELPQIWSVIIGDMNFVGPRPALFNQNDLIDLRIKEGVDKLLPGITGWAQVNGRDELSIPDKVLLDIEYLKHQSILFDIKILWITFLIYFLNLRRIIRIYY